MAQRSDPVGAGADELGATVLDPVDAYLHLAEGPAVARLAGGEAFWAGLDERPELHRGRLVCCFEQDADWRAWELHPVGDEVVMVLGGSCTVHLHPDDGSEEPLAATDGATRSVRLGDGRYVLVPPGVWHTMDVHEPGRLLAITWGEGTPHRPRRDAGPAR